MHHRQVTDSASGARLATTDAAPPRTEGIVLPPAVDAEGVILPAAVEAEGIALPPVVEATPPARTPDLPRAPALDAESPASARPPALDAESPASARPPARWSSPLSQAMATLLVDATSLVVAAAALMLATPAGSDLDRAAVAAYPAVVLLLLAASRRYRPRWSRPTSGELRGSLAAAAVGALALSAGALALGADPLTSTQLLWLWVVSAVALCLGEVLVAGLIARGRRRGSLTAPTLIIGAGRVGHLIASRLLERPEAGLRPVGFLDDNPLDRADQEASLPVLGPKDDLERMIREHGIARVVIAFSTASDQLLLSIARRCGALGVGVCIVPRLYEVEGTRRSALRLGGLPLVELPFEDPDRLSLRAKYTADRLAALVAWPLLAPVLGAIALAVRLTMGRPILHRQERVGRDGQVFAMLKFRTMRGRPDSDGEADAEWLQEILGPDGTPLRPHSSSSAADRTTALGRFLRRFSLDELPQLWNVIRGDMSLVGPRPERVSYVDRLAPVIYRYGERHRVKPGITGWAQVNGLRGRTSLDDRIEWDNYYVENWSLGLDLSIAIRTLGCLLRGSPQDGLSVRPEEAAERCPRSSARRRGDDHSEPLSRAQRLRAVSRLLGLFIVVLPFAVGLSTAAAASSRGPSAADQYVEQVPTVTGSKPADSGDDRAQQRGDTGDASSGGPSSGGGTGGASGGGGTGGAGTGAPGRSGATDNGATGGNAVPLSLAARAALSQIDQGDARELERVATSPQLGAPQGRVKAPGESARDEPGEPSLPSAVISAASDDDGGGVFTLLLVAVATTAIVAFAAAGYERRQQRRATG